MPADRDRDQRRRAARSSGAGVLVLTVLRLWPLYIAAPVVVGLGALATGEPGRDALAVAVDVLVFAIWMGPLGWIAANEGLSMLGWGIGWLALAWPVAAVVLERFGT